MDKRLGGRNYRLLVAWFGLYQSAHLINNALYFVTNTEFPPPPSQPPWHVHARCFFDGMAASDMAVAVVSLVFVFAFLHGRSWALPLGLMTLSVSLYAAVVFTWGCITAGVFTWAHATELGIIYLAYVPVVILFAWTLLIVCRTPLGLRYTSS